MEMLLSILSIVANILFFVVLNLSLYTDRAMMPGGQIRQWQRSPIDRLRISDQQALLYLQVLFAAVSVVCSVLVLCGVKNSVVKKLRLIGTIASAAVFLAIMILTGAAQPRYA